MRSGHTQSCETLVVSYRQNPEDLARRMRLEGKAVIANQTDHSLRRSIPLPKGGLATVVETTTTGVGINRNIALSQATADICLFGDDDVVYHDGYCDMVVSAFDSWPDADLIFFNLSGSQRELYTITHSFQVKPWNFLRFGTARVAFRRESIDRAGIRFDERFGGGARYLHGEDTIFFAHCLRAGLKLYAVTTEIGILTADRESTWSRGYDTRYIHDQGALYKAMSPRLWPLWALQDALRRSKKHYDMSPSAALKLMFAGARSSHSKRP